jgi:hypothetical protein
VQPSAAHGEVQNRADTDDHKGSAVRGDEQGIVAFVD